MRKPQTRLALAVAAVLAVGCGQGDQTLPFSSDFEQEVRRTINSTTGGTISSPSGISVVFPPGSLPETQEITVRRVSGTGGLDGDLLEGSVVSIEPAGLVLNEPARVEVWVPGLADLSPEEQLNLGVMVLTGPPEGSNGVAAAHDGNSLPRPACQTQVPGGPPSSNHQGHCPALDADLTNGIAGTNTSSTGSFGVGHSPFSLFLTPPNHAQLFAGPLYPDPSQTTVTYELACSGASCLDLLEMVAGEQLLERYDGRLAAVQPDFVASLTFERDLATPDVGTVVGSIRGAVFARLRTDGALTSMPYEVSIHAEAGTPYALDDNQLSFAGVTMLFSVQQFVTGRVLTLALPPTQIELPLGDDTEIVALGGQIALTMVD